MLIQTDHVGVIAPAWAKSFLDLFPPVSPLLLDVAQFPFGGNVRRWL